MAGDWIPWAKGLSRKVEVLCISQATGRSRREVACLLMEFWEWADAETEDGFLSGMDVRILSALHADTDTAFWSAVISVGWLCAVDGGLNVPHFDYWMGASAKRRLKDTKRKRQSREGGDSDPVRILSASHADKNGTTGEDRREEKECIPPSPLPGGAEAKQRNRERVAKKPPDVAPTAAEVMEAWNTAASASGWTPCHVMGEQRLRSYRARIQDSHWLGHWRAALAKASGLVWLKGENRRQWVADIDWFLRPRTVARVLEGHYDDRQAGSRPIQGTDRQALWDAAFQAKEASRNGHGSVPGVGGSPRDGVQPENPG